MMVVSFFFFQAEDGIRDLVRSRGLGDVYKRQGDQAVFDTPRGPAQVDLHPARVFVFVHDGLEDVGRHHGCELSLIHI